MSSQRKKKWRLRLPKIRNLARHLGKMTRVRNPERKSYHPNSKRKWRGRPVRERRDRLPSLITGRS